MLRAWARIFVELLCDNAEPDAIQHQKNHNRRDIQLREMPHTRQSLGGRGKKELVRR